MENLHKTCFLLMKNNNIKSIISLRLKSKSKNPAVWRDNGFPHTKNKPSVYEYTNTTLNRSNGLWLFKYCPFFAVIYKKSSAVLFSKIMVCVWYIYGGHQTIYVLMTLQFSLNIQWKLFNLIFLLDNQFSAKIIAIHCFNCIWIYSSLRKLISTQLYKMRAYIIKIIYM